MNQSQEQDESKMAEEAVSQSQEQDESKIAEEAVSQMEVQEERRILGTSAVAAQGTLEDP